MTEKLDISSLIKAAESFSNAIMAAKTVESEYPDEIFYLVESVRASVIQHFEYTYELSWKMMKKFIEIDHGRIESSTRRGLFREAGELGLIDDFNKWMKFNKARNLTSHTYDEDTAKEVYAAAKEFDKYLKKFISNLDEKIKDL